MINYIGGIVTVAVAIAIKSYCKFTTCDFLLCKKHVFSEPIISGKKVQGA
jgi:hypothetical protein